MPGAVAGVVVLVVVWLAAGLPVAVGPAVVVGVAAAVATWWRAPVAILRSLGARPADEDRWPRPFGIVDGLCATMGLSAPDLWLVAEDAPNALAVGTRPASTVLVLTTGLVERLDPVQLEGVLAHELSHVKHGEVALGTVAAALALPFAGLFDTGGAVHRVRGRGCELLTDRRAVGVTRYPPALRTALAAMADAGQGRAPAGSAPPAGGAAPAGGAGAGLAATAAGRATRWLWTVALGQAPQGAALVGELDEPEVRIAALDEL